MKRSLVWILLVLALIAGCGGGQKQGVQRTQLEIRQMQTRDYEAQDMRTIMESMLNVLQDDGFMVKQVDMDLGFFNATKETDVENRKESSWQKFWYGRNYAIYKKNAIMDCTANVSEFGSEMRVRVTFQVKVMNNKGGVVSVRQVDDPKYYQDFFSKVDKGIFIEKEKL